MRGIAFTDSVHDRSDKKAVIKYLKANAINWVTSDTALNTELPDEQVIDRVYRLVWQPLHVHRATAASGPQATLGMRTRRGLHTAPYSRTSVSRSTATTSSSVTSARRRRRQTSEAVHTRIVNQRRVVY